MSELFEALRMSVIIILEEDKKKKEELEQRAAFGKVIAEFKVPELPRRRELGM